MQYLCHCNNSVIYVANLPRTCFECSMSGDGLSCSSMSGDGLAIGLRLGHALTETQQHKQQAFIKQQQRRIEHLVAS
ncbi:hypothetical protein OPV22_031971 [Ensete ventricosum]|uniref:Uncharacterized protein n=1 Tax=Ensete ventricosum TaxID=4639 RepID=A0AAV8PW46_ENSVE|nr:hypothetical protein OPV22_031971 [Ensete ventricosum]